MSFFNLQKQLSRSRCPLAGCTASAQGPGGLGCVQRERKLIICRQGQHLMPLNSWSHIIRYNGFQRPVSKCDKLPPEWGFPCRIREQPTRIIGRRFETELTIGPSKHLRSVFKKKIEKGYTFGIFVRSFCITALLPAILGNFHPNLKLISGCFTHTDL